MNNAETKSKDEGQRAAAKKAYSTPQLTFYGDVSQVTRGGGGTMGDAPGGATMMCWIAEALYGVDAPRTHLVRAWLRESYERRVSWALVVVPLYRRFGQRVAASVRRHSFLQSLFRRVFDHAVRKAHVEFAVRATLLNQAA